MLFGELTQAMSPSGAQGLHELPGGWRSLLAAFRDYAGFPHNCTGSDMFSVRSMKQVRFHPVSEMSFRWLKESV